MTGNVGYVRFHAVFDIAQARASLEQFFRRWVGYRSLFSALEEMHLSRRKDGFAATFLEGSDCGRGCNVGGITMCF
jgi:hypothetical protein